MPLMRFCPAEITHKLFGGKKMFPPNENSPTFFHFAVFLLSEKYILEEKKKNAD